MSVRLTGRLPPSGPGRRPPGATRGCQEITSSHSRFLLLMGQNVTGPLLEHSHKNAAGHVLACCQKAVIFSTDRVENARTKSRPFLLLERCWSVRKAARPKAYASGWLAARRTNRPVPHDPVGGGHKSAAWSRAMKRSLCAIQAISPPSSSTLDSVGESRAVTQIHQQVILMTLLCCSIPVLDYAGNGRNARSMLENRSLGAIPH